MKRQRTWKNYTVSKAELARLVGRDIGCIEYWTRVGGLPRKANGRYYLKTALSWIEQHYRDSKSKIIDGDKLSQKDLVKLFGMTRQGVAGWERKGLPRRKDGRYELRAVCQWLRKYYRDSSEAKYQSRLTALKKKLHRNIKQIEKFIGAEK